MRPVSWVRLVALALLWGSNFLLITVALDSFNPLQILIGRMWLGAAVLLAVVLAAREALPRDRRTWGHLTVAAVVANLVPYYLFGWGQQYVASSLAGVINATTPLFTLALAWATRTDQRLTPRQVAGLLLGFLGVAVISEPWSTASGPSAPGLLAVLAAAASYGLAYVYQRRFLVNRGTSPRALAAGQLTAASVLLLPALPLSLLTGLPAGVSLTSVGALLTLGVLGTGAAYVLNYRLIADEGATRASVVTYLLPVVSVSLGWAVLGEAAGWTLLSGGALVLAGVALVQRRSAAPR